MKRFYYILPIITLLTLPLVSVGQHHPITPPDIPTKKPVTEEVKEEAKPENTQPKPKKNTATTGVKPTPKEKTAEELFFEGCNARDVEDYTKAFQLFLQAANKGHARAQAYVGFYYEHALGVEHNTIEALTWYLKSAELGDDCGMYELANIYINVLYEPAKALKWFLKAAELGNPAAQYKLGDIYFDGEGAEKNHEEAMRWYLKAAENGIAEAQCNIGMMYLRGDGCEENNEESFKWLMKAAEQEIEYAQFIVGIMYEHGVGTNQNFEEAAIWYLKAAENGNSSAQYKMGVYCDNIKNNPDEALKWYTEAAEKGEHYAQYKLFNIYRKGLNGVDSNMREAFKWLNEVLRNEEQDIDLAEVGDVLFTKEPDNNGIESMIYVMFNDEERSQIRTFFLHKARKSMDSHICDIYINLTFTEAVLSMDKCSLVTAFHLFKEIADNEFNLELSSITRSQIYIGYMYQKGCGVEKDKKLANVYLTLANNSHGDDSYLFQIIEDRVIEVKKNCSR